jgi:aryl-alcohol dehydrogenase-like predicted oxidoreductase
METSEPCHLYNVKLLPYGVLAGGFLSGKYLNGAKPEGARFVRYPGFQYRYATKAVEEAAIKYKALAEKKGLSLTQLAVAWYVSLFSMTSCTASFTRQDRTACWCSQP